MTASEPAFGGPDPQREGAKTGSLLQWRTWLAFPAVLALFAGILAGWARLGLDAGAGGRLAGGHGPLMVSGFLGTLITLERAVASGRGWAFLLPGMSGAAGLLMLAGAPAAWPALLGTAAAVGLAALPAWIPRMRVGLPAWVGSAGALCWAAGSLAWLATGRVPAAVAWWAAFLVLTIAGERLELTRFLPVSRVRVWLLLEALGLLGAGLAVTAVAPSPGTRITGIALVLVAVWLLVHDMAWKALARRGQSRFTAVCLLAGYAWLLVAGGALALWAPAGGGTHYDLAWHALFLGFVFSMIFGHAPIVFPALLGRAVPFRLALYVPLAVLHLSLAARLAGDAAGHSGLRLWGGLFNGLAIFGFFAVMAASGLLPHRERRNSRPPAESTG